ncbi:DUF4436 domain-containing protein [Mycobacterium rhizamassiliense]|uniref:DUF4436 domain-containing protein n=1 Tax=Mycobacterium rhizamassiliense TaxID=1841860 RepID=UPI00097DA0B3|nr:DUF4436 domain-containing protein [Mycobacterium rhizamassiliense]
MKFGIVGIIVAVIGAYIASVALYANAGGAHRHDAEAPAASDRTTVELDVSEVQSNYSVLVANVTVFPGPELLDPQSGHLKEDLGLRVRSTASPARRTWTKGMLPGDFPVPLTLAGDIDEWPLDHYSTGPIEVELMRNGSDKAIERVPVTFVNHLSGWSTKIDGAPGLGAHRVSLHRSLSAGAFGVVILGILIAIAGLALFVAIQTVRDRRKFQPPMTTWYAAMLFAVVPLRNALPGSPPFGGWIDITIVLWVLVALVVSMLLYITCWWRHLRPEPMKVP